MPRSVKQDTGAIPNPGGLYPHFESSISLSYYKRFWSAFQNGKENPASVLRELLLEHSSEFFGADWVAQAAGAVLLDLHGSRDKKSNKTAKRFFDFYWRHVLSPKHEKIIRAYRAREFLLSKHRDHWLAALHWMKRLADWPVVNEHAVAKKYLLDPPVRCDCLSVAQVKLICDVGHRSENDLSPAEVVFKCAAGAHGLSARSLRSYMRARK